MSHERRHAQTGSTVGGIVEYDDSDLPPSCRAPEGGWAIPEPEIARRCGCGARLSRYNLGPLCYSCKDDDLPTPARFNSYTGFKGVIKAGDKYRAQRQIHGRKRDLGIFATAQEAHEAWKKAT